MLPRSGFLLFTFIVCVVEPWLKRTKPTKPGNPDKALPGRHVQIQIDMIQRP